MLTKDLNLMKLSMIQLLNNSKIKLIYI